MDFNGAIGDQGEFWEWQSHEYDLQKNLLADPCMWAELSNNGGVDWNMFDDQTPIKHCADFEQFCDDMEVVKEPDEGKETVQAKRRRQLQFRQENVETTSSMAEDGLSESLQYMDFSVTDCLLNSDGTDELPEEWLVSCPEDTEPGFPAQEMNSSPVAAMEKAVDISVQQNSPPCQQQAIVVSSNLAPLKAGRSVIISKKSLTSSVAFPFELIKPCSISGDITLNDINKKIHAPPPYKIKHKSHEEPSSLQASAISGKPVVHMTKIHTEGKGSITITRTKG